MSICFVSKNCSIVTKIGNITVDFFYFFIYNKSILKWVDVKFHALKEGIVGQQYAEPAVRFSLYGEWKYTAHKATYT